ncbi:MAG: hypothetical protein RIT04_74 [Candidatus Parcubacteria bacterium]|jgi:uncharacterized protein YqgC (DUF456 family)
MGFLTIVIVATIFLLPGIVMALVPGLPGLLYMFIIACIFGLVNSFVNLSGTEVGILAAIVGIAMLIDMFSGVVGAKWGGAHWSSLFSGIIGLVVGTFIIPIPILGSLIGLFLGVLISEWYITRDMRKAQKAALGSLAGSAVGITANVIAAILFVSLFLFFVLR